MDKKISFIKDLVTLVLLIGTLLVGSYISFKENDNLSNQKISQIQIDVKDIKRELPTLRVKLDKNVSDIGLLKHRVDNLSKQNEETKQWREDLIRVQEQNKQIAASLDRTSKKLDEITARLDRWGK
ncbi:hypothetical protein [Shewanella sp. SE1]|uniref:hypothetical protein n=1 Tax=Shewanella sp. SE1 TaxID=2705014 RepID=UPI00138F6A38|nr:hypothetical protein [Shewanella sp. SE1]NDO73078.1 hypothetical protein [Shewanella sp. SE1]